VKKITTEWYNMTWKRPHISEMRNQYERRDIETPPDLEEIVRSLKDELQSYRDDNEKLIRAQEK
jgi:hypothetical protein